MLYPFPDCFTALEEKWDSECLTGSLRAGDGGYPLSRLRKKGGFPFSSRTTVKPVDIVGH